MKICHLTSVHPVRDIRIFHKECVSLASAGFEVHLVAIGTEGSFSEKGVNVHTLNIKSSGRISRITKTAKQVSRYALSLNADVYHMHDAELLLYSGLFTRNKKIVIYDVHEDLPLQITAKHWIPVYFRKPISWLAGHFEKYFVKNLYGIVAATQPIADVFYSIGKPVIVIRNFPMLHEFKTINRDSPVSGLLCYLGSVSKVRGIKEVIESLTLSSSKLLLAGSYSPEGLRAELCTMSGWERVEEFGTVDRNKVKEILETASIGLVTLLPAANFIESLPIKMFEYMAAGLPVIASDFPLWKEIVEVSGCGICVNPEKPKEIAAAVIRLRDDPELASAMGARGKAAVLEKYNWKNEEALLLEYYHSIKIGEKS
ncbi:MAG: glycosyltransferase family 4 protein [Bacteroidales bacterium]|jgi:glycosyltransferase involved in cell wall biosynthesis|nr:glycosyltransferase family 4 protein [Bacteroidales bacterium]